MFSSRIKQVNFVILFSMLSVYGIETDTLVSLFY